MTATWTAREPADFQARMRLSVLWISVTLCYAYADIIALFLPGGLRMMLEGNMGPWPVTQQLLLGVAVLMAISPIMACVSLVFGQRTIRALNVSVALAFLAVAVASMVWSWRLGNLHYAFFNALEGVMNTLIVACALRWPKAQAPA